MKPKTLEDALFETGAPDEIILLAMIECIKQGKEGRISINPINNMPLCSMMRWDLTEQGLDFWGSINELYQIRTQ